jgi:hypothetical protein
MINIFGSFSLKASEESQLKENALDIGNLWTLKEITHLVIERLIFN